MVVWVGDGEFATFYTDALHYGHGVLTTPNGLGIDTQFITRLQYATPGSSAINQVLARGVFDFIGTETGSPNLGTWGRRAAMFIVPASFFPAGAVPTAQQVYDAGPSAMVFRGRLSSGSWNDVAHVDFFGPGPAQLQAGTKYWCMIMPTWSFLTQVNPTTNSERPLLTGGGAPNTVGRVVSFWTNRPPSKPQITFPADRAVISPATTMTMTWTTPDPDNVSTYPDLVGGQVQVAEQAAPGVTPTWRNLVFRGSGGVAGGSWYIENNPGTVDGSTANGLDTDVLTGRTLIQIGRELPTADLRAALPAGNWQLRVRTFDRGHPAVADHPIDGVGTTYTPESYPSSNTSPWSDPVRISVLTQVPPPEPVSPKNRVAISRDKIPSLALWWKYKNQSAPVAGTTLTSGVTAGTVLTLPVAALTVAWPIHQVFRLANGQLAKISSGVPAGTTSLPIGSVDGFVFVLNSNLASGTALVPFPLPQATRTVQVRKVGDSSWTNLVTSDVDDQVGINFDTGVFPLFATNEYEWRVKVTDSSGASSDYSTPARFWIVPTPASGVVVPTPEESIEGATLGCGTNRAFIYRRGGLTRVGEVTGISHLDWGRLRDDISTANVVVKNWDIDCGNLLSKLQTWAYELVIFRTTGYGTERVWEGPITLLTYENDAVTIDAKDVVAYPYRRIIKQKIQDDNATVVERAVQILQNVLAVDDPNVLSYLTPVPKDGDSPQNRSTEAWSKTAYEEIDDMAANTGLDYTALGRSIIIWGTKTRLGTLPEFRDENLGSTPIVSEYGMQFANRYVLTDGQGAYGEANRLDVDGLDPIYGLVEMLASTASTENTPTEGTYTAPTETTIANFEKQAEKAISDRYPPPVVVRIPDNTTIHPDTPVTIQQLVPGVVLPLRSTSTLRAVVGDQKLDSMKVVEEGGKETITITLSPFNYDLADESTE